MNLVAKLKTLAVPVIAARPPSDQPCIFAGFVEESPLGPSVALGAAATLPGSPGLAFIGHLSADEADDAGDLLKEGAAKLRAYLSGQARLPSPEIAKRMIEQAESGATGPCIIPARIHPNGDIEPLEPIQGGATVAGEAMGMMAQVQRPSPAEAATEPGQVGLGAVMTPLGPSYVLHLFHPDGESLHAIIEPERFPMFIQLQELATADLQALANGAPKGEPVQ